jgi:hypothetical protein
MVRGGRTQDKAGASAEHNAAGSLLDTALGYAARGWHVLQNHPRTKKPVVDDWQHAATSDRALIERWWASNPYCNVGVQLGPRSGLIDVECDAPAAERELGALLGESYSVVPTFRGKRGKHRLFLHTPGLPCPDKAVFKWRGVEFRTGNGGKGAQSIFPPSVHPDGPVYTWLVGPDEADPVPFPAATPAVVRAEVEAPRRRPRPQGGAPWVGPAPKAGRVPADLLLRRALKLTDGGRDNAGLWLACQLRDAGYSEAEARPVLLAYQHEVCEQGDHPFTEGEALHNLHSAFTRPARQPWGSSRRGRCRPLFQFPITTPAGAKS